MATADRIGIMLAGALATFKLSTERDRAQLAVSESDTRFRQIADKISGVFWLVELDPRRLLYASPNAEEVGTHRWQIPTLTLERSTGTFTLKTGK